MAKNQNLRFSQISAIRGGLFRLIFTCEPSRPHALGSGAGALHRIQSCGRGCAFSKTSRTDENLVVSGACASVSENSSTDDVLGRRRRPFGLSATREDRNPARAQRRLWRLMASKTEETPQKEEMLEKDGPETLPDSPLLDLSDPAVKELIRSAKKRGYVTHDQINSVLPSEEDSEQIKDVLAIFSEMGVNVVETEETSKEGDREEGEESDEETESESGELVEVQQKVPAKSEAKEPTERTDDPVRMYLREMGSVELLSREGEIAIAKRIEAGREAMIAGLCESPLTFQAIIIWRDELN